MTSVGHIVKTVTRHIWVVPCYGEQTSAVMGDVQDAMLFAERKLEELGRPVKSSTAFFVRPVDDEIHVWFDHEEKYSDEPRPDTLADFQQWCADFAVPSEEEAVRRLIAEYRQLRGA